MTTINTIVARTCPVCQGAFVDAFYLAQHFLSEHPHTPPSPALLASLQTEILEACEMWQKLELLGPPR